MVKCETDDIDLSIINPDSLPELFNVLKKYKIKYKKHYIDNFLYKVTFKIDLPNTIELRVFNLKNKYYYSPFIPLSNSNTISYFKKFSILKFFWDLFFKKIFYKFFSKSIIFENFYWKIPKKYFVYEMNFNNLSNIYFPRHYKDYLTYRYGNWNIINDNWDVRNDGGLVNDKI